MPQTVHVVARLIARPETIAAAQALLLALIAPTRQEGVACATNSCTTAASRPISLL